MGIDGNHSEICKFPGPRHHGYVAVLGALEDYYGMAVRKRSAQAGIEPSLSLASPVSWDASKANNSMPTLRSTPQPRTETPPPSGPASQHETVERPQALTQSDQLQSRFSEGKNLAYSNLVLILMESFFFQDISMSRRRPLNQAKLQTNRFQCQHPHYQENQQIVCL
jgi:hypothetical protein